MRRIYLFILMIGTIEATVPESDNLLTLHKVSTSEMNAIVSPVEGSLVFNTEDENIYERNATAWYKITSDGSETKIVSGSCLDITGTGTASDAYLINKNLLGKTKATAGLSCMKMLETGCAITDGTYWINPDGGSTSNAFEVYCDMSGGGWTRIEYAADLTHEQQFTGGDTNSWLPSNFTLVLTDTQINDIRSISTEGKQQYHGTCDHVIHYSSPGSTNGSAFGFRFHENSETSSNQLSYPTTHITILNDGCINNDHTLRFTDFYIEDVRVPIINVHSRDNGDDGEEFGSPLTNYPAWLR